MTVNLFDSILGITAKPGIELSSLVVASQYKSYFAILFGNDLHIMAIFGHLHVPF